MKKILFYTFILFIGLTLSACSKDKETVLLATTTSTENSGLLDYLLPYFEEDTGITVKVVAVGTGAALEMGRMGEADLLLVHDTLAELTFIDEGYGSLRSDVMYNDFVIVGPREIDLNSLEGIMTYIEQNELDFISRGDNSGTHAKELRLWESFSLSPSGDWYIESGQGMGATLTMASEKEAYTLTDRATFYTMDDSLELEIIFEDKVNLINPYGVILINPDLHKNINSDGAIRLYDWLLSSRGQSLINDFGKDVYPKPLFTANAPKE